MGLLEWYVVSVIVCFVLFNLTSKLCDGQITVGCLVSSLILSVIPFANVVITLSAIYVLLVSANNSSIMSKKLF